MISPSRATRCALTMLPLCLLPLAACGGNQATTGSGETTIATTFYPLQWVAEEVAGDKAEVISFANPGAEAHGLELTPAQVAQMGEASLGFYESGLQPQVDSAIETNPPSAVVDVVDLITLKEADEEHMHEHGDEHDDKHEHSDEHEHDHGGLDPHFWLDPTLLAEAAEAFAKELGTVDTDNAATYEKNAADLAQRLTELDEKISSGLSQCQRTQIVTSHDAFGYFAERYGLDVLSIAGLSPDIEPSPRHIQELRELIEDQDITTVFYEEIATPANAKALAADMKLETAVLDPIEAVKADSDLDYVGIMEANLASLREANECG